jgi:AraC-like DNA-binding protein
VGSPYALGSERDHVYHVVLTNPPFGKSPRMLQETLKAEGTRYQKIVRDLKARTAKECRSTTTLPLSEIALQLGYSELQNRVRSTTLSENGPA